MGMSKLFLSKEVAPASEEYITFTPPSGKQCIVSLFQGDGPGSKWAVVKLIWKYGAVGETILWSIKGNHELTVPIELPIGEVDGVNSLAIAMENSDIVPIYLSGLAIIEVAE
jgi:hypothetical protein